MTATTESRDAQAPITVLARHRITPGKEKAFEDWSHGVAAACRDFSGYLGTEVIRPATSKDNELVSIFRFDTYEHLETWMDSTERASWLDRTSAFSHKQPRVEHHSLELWFSPRSEVAKGPPRYKMAAVTFAAIWPLVHFVPPGVAWALGSPPVLIEVTAVAAIVLLMTYVVMPLATRLVAPWLLS